jgi:hypothetical protein
MNRDDNKRDQPMRDKEDVQRSPDEKTDQDFPGYPHYPAKEDIMDQRTDSHRVDVDMENLPNQNASRVSQRFLAGQDREKARDAMTPQPGVGDDDLDIRPGTEADVTEDDLAVLNSANAEIGTPQNVSNEDLNSDLDIPGSELDDKNEEIGEEDEENNYYSLGGDRQESNEEDPYSGPNRGNE